MSHTSLSNFSLCNVGLATNLNVEPENIVGNEKEADETAKGEGTVKEEVGEFKSDAHSNEKEGKVNESKKEIPAVKEAAVDKELLQACWFFDRNYVGYIRVEDMRLIIHSLGMFLSHRDVKELVRNAFAGKQQWEGRSNNFIISWCG